MPGACCAAGCAPPGRAGGRSICCSRATSAASRTRSPTSRARLVVRGGDELGALRRRVGVFSPGQTPVRCSSPARRSGRRSRATTLKITPWTAAAPSTFAQWASRVVDFGGSSSSNLPQATSNSLRR